MPADNRYPLNPEGYPENSEKFKEKVREQLRDDSKARAFRSFTDQLGSSFRRNSERDRDKS